MGTGLGRGRLRGATAPAVEGQWLRRPAPHALRLLLGVLWPLAYYPLDNCQRDEGSSENPPSRQGREDSWTSQRDETALALASFAREMLMASSAQSKTQR